jgi:hypothetical protein
MPEPFLVRAQNPLGTERRGNGIKATRASMRLALRGKINPFNPPSLSIITTAREALWNAINNWSALKADPDDKLASKFKAFFRYDDSMELPVWKNPEPSLSELPAISIWTSGVDPRWYLNQGQLWPIGFEITIWTPGYHLPTCEKFVADVWNAIHNAVIPETTVTWLKNALGGGSEMALAGSIEFRRRTVGTHSEDY